jgi:uncharacterized oligopeptide transporter (OPT) family protein
MRINTSMVIGMTIAWVIAPPILVEQGLVANLVRREVQLWILWPAVGVLVAGGLTTLALRWKVLVKSFRGLTSATVGAGEFPMKWVIWGSIASAIALALVQRFSLGMPFGLTAIAIVLSIPLMLVGIRVLGETNWGPISALTNMAQGIFGAVAPGSILYNLTASGVTGSVATQSEGLMQDYKTGHLIGSTPRLLTYAQLIAVPVGAAAVAFVYPLLRDTYGIGGDNGLQSPISQRFAGWRASSPPASMRCPRERPSRCWSASRPACCSLSSRTTRRRGASCRRPRGWASACWCREARCSRCSSADCSASCGRSRHRRPTSVT